jgi:hypothetical protein
LRSLLGIRQPLKHFITDPRVVIRAFPRARETGFRVFGFREGNPLPGQLRVPFSMHPIDDVAFDVIPCPS